MKFWKCSSFTRSILTKTFHHQFAMISSFETTTLFSDQQSLSPSASLLRYHPFPSSLSVYATVDNPPVINLSRISPFVVLNHRANATAQVFVNLKEIIRNEASRGNVSLVCKRSARAGRRGNDAAADIYLTSQPWTSARD